MFGRNRIEKEILDTDIQLHLIQFIEKMAQASNRRTMLKFWCADGQQGCINVSLVCTAWCGLTSGGVPTITVNSTSGCADSFRFKTLEDAQTVFKSI